MINDDGLLITTILIIRKDKTTKNISIFFFSLFNIFLLRKRYKLKFFFVLFEKLKKKNETKRKKTRP
jgi:hypothetical protein